MSRPRCLLALDTAGTACSAAVFREGEVVATCFETMRRGQSERLLPMIGEVMADAGVTYRDLDAIGVTRGPGAFTGVRIGLATARALGLAAGKPVLAATCFETALAAVPPQLRRSDDSERLILVALDAKRADVYAQVFDASGATRSEPQALLPELLSELLAEASEAALPQPVVVAGDAEAVALHALEAAGIAALGVQGETGHAAVPNAASLARLLAERDLPAAPGEAPRPMYLRPPDVTLPK